METFRRKLRNSIIFACVILTTGCTPGCTISPLEPGPPVVHDSELCAPACQNLERLSCEEAQPIPMGTSCSVDAGVGCGETEYCSIDADAGAGMCMTTCEQFCIVTQNQGVGLKPGCVMQINQCSEIEMCL